MGNMEMLSHLLTIIFLTTDVEAQNIWPSANFRRYTGKKISHITTLNTYTVKADLDAVCAFLCQAKGSSCFAAQYQKGSRQCSLQLDCGVVQLQSDPTSLTSVHVRSTLVNENDAIQPYLSFPLAKGCNSSFANNYGVESVTTPPTLLGNVGEYNTTYPAFATTLWFPTTAFPTSSYVSIEDTNGKLDLFQGSFTISYFVNIGANAMILPAMTFLSTSTTVCLALRVNNKDGSWLFRKQNCLCDSAYARSGITPWAEVDGWAHILYSYQYSTGTMKVFINGAVSLIYTDEITFTASPRILLLGATNTCNQIAQNSLRGSLACLQFMNRSVTQAEALTLYNQCINGVVYV